MKISLMRSLDSLVGVPVCWLLTLLRQLQGPCVQPPRELAGRKILFIKLAEQGSTVLALPMLRRAAEIFGAENLYFLVFEENCFVLHMSNIIPRENIITLPHRGILEVFCGVIPALIKIRRLKLDFAVDMEFFARSTAALTYLSGARWRIGFHAFHGDGSYRGDLMTHRLLCNQQIHVADLFQIMLDAVFVDPGELPTFGKKISSYKETAAVPLPPLRLEAAEIDKVRGILRSIAGDTAGLPLILFNSNCGDLLPLRRWPEENYQKLSLRLLERWPELHIGFTGSPSEEKDSVRQVRLINHPRCFNLAGKTSLPGLLALYSLSEILVTNDSGPAHFATLTSIDTVTLFGPETPALFGARTERSHILWAGLACSPCVNAFNDRQTACRNNLCMQSIGVDEVFDLVCSLYEKRRGSTRIFHSP